MGTQYLSHNNDQVIYIFTAEFLNVSLHWMIHRMANDYLHDLNLGSGQNFHFRNTNTQQ